MRRTRTFPAIPQSVRAARRFAVDVVVGTPAQTVEAVELMVSELATNCIKHEGASFQVDVACTSGEILVEVTDGGSGMPRMRSAGPDEPSGRGLQIVDMLSDRWGVHRDIPSGKTVWFTVATSPSRGPRPRRAAARLGSAANVPVSASGRRGAADAQASHRFLSKPWQGAAPVPA
jgi:anti-sigma regulatory factor (Ser/Thr protein kinase)